MQPKTEAGATLVELLVAAVLIVVFFAAIFEVNAVCLRYVAAGKESLGAIAVVNDRTEMLRNLSFSDLTTSSVVAGLLATPSNDTEFAGRLNEVVKITTFPTASGSTQFTRNPAGNVMIASSGSLHSSSLVQVEVSCSWQAVFGKRDRTEKVTTIISNGTKK